MFSTTRTTTLVFIICFFHTGLKFAMGATWHYDHEDEWPALCKEGTRQSPIPLSRDTAQEKNFSSLIFGQYQVKHPAVSKNNGHTLEIRLQAESNLTVKGGGLPHVYVLDNLHFHWKSEHVIERERFPLELHLVHYANIYPNVAEALKNTGGVAVFGVLFDFSPDDSKKFEPLTTVLDKIDEQVNGTSEEIQIRVKDFIPKDTAGFFRYNGSLTTPECTEGIIWTVFTNKILIAKDQVKAFHRLKTEENKELVQNYRSLQKLNSRRVQLKSSPTDGGNGTIKIDFTIYLGVLLFVIVRRF